jgi:hypothetical protein
MWETRSVFHISMPHFLRQDSLRRRWPVPERGMWPHRVVVHSPPLDHHLCLLQRVEDLALQTFILQLAVEADEHDFVITCVTVMIGGGRFRYGIQ